MAAAAAGDTIQIDASGVYKGDVCAISKNNLTLQGVNGRPLIDAGGLSAQGKAIWVIAGNDTIVDNVEFTGATVTSGNGAGIRQEGTNLTLRNSYFHDNEEGILAGPNLASSILIENTEFARNGLGDGFTHNIYIGNVARFTLQFSYSHHAKVGHLVKSRAAVNYILYNRLTDETGTASYELDVPNGGLTYVIGNLFQQSPTTSNPSIFGYMLEGAAAGNPSHALFVVNNTFVNSRGSGTFININPADTTPAVVQNNIFSGGGTTINQSAATMTGNYTGTPTFVNAAAYDYRLAAGSAGIDAGTAPGTGSGFSLTPVFQYVHPVCDEGRVTVGTIDAGAYEFNGGTGVASGCAVNPPGSPKVASISLAPATVVGGSPSTGSVSLSGMAGSGGALVTLNSSDPSVTLPATVTIAPNVSSANFVISTSAVSTSITSNITASYSASSVSATLTVNPPAPVLSSITLSQSSVSSGATLTGNSVSLTAPAGAGGAVVTLSSGTPAVASVAASATVPAGSANGSFSLVAGSPSATTTVGISASYGGVSQTAFVTVNPAPPSLSALLPASATAGSTVAVILSGANFQQGATVSAGGSGITVSGVSVVSATQINATFAIPASAAAGLYSVSVNSGGALSNAQSFTVTAASSVPTLSALSPASAQAGSKVNVTLSGTNFTAGSVVRLSGLGAAISSAAFVSPTQINAVFTFKPTTATGPHNVSVATSAGTSNVLTFNVTPVTGAPALTSITPNNAAQGAIVNVTLNGTNFVAGASVGVGGSGVTVSNVSVVSTTRITATLTVAASAASGPYNVSVSTAGGSSNTLPFSVTASSALPVLTSIAPGSGTQGGTVNVSLNGANFAAGATVGVSGTGVAVSNVTVVNATRITATLTIGATAATGAYNINVKTSAGTSGSVAFTVNSASTAPALSSMNPSSASRGTSVSVTLSGSNFTPQSSVRLSGVGAAYSNVVVVSPTQINVTFTFAPTTATGVHNVYVVTSAGSSNVLPFTVN